MCLLQSHSIRRLTLYLNSVPLFFLWVEFSLWYVLSLKFLWWFRLIHEWIAVRTVAWALLFLVLWQKTVRKIFIDWLTLCPVFAKIVEVCRISKVERAVFSARSFMKDILLDKLLKLNLPFRKYFALVFNKKCFLVIFLTILNVVFGIN